MPWTAQRIAIAVALVSITSFFVALVVAYGVILHGLPRPPIVVPPALWISTGLLAFSSAAFELARYSLRRARLRTYRTQLDAAVIAGILFLASQFAAWWDLWEQGVYVRANPQGSIFYSFTGFHALHVIGGLAGLIWLHRRARRLQADQEHPLRRHRLNAGTAAVYWHFMGILWLALFALLIAWS